MVHPLGTFEGIKYWSSAVGLLFIKACGIYRKKQL